MKPLQLIFKILVLFFPVIYLFSDAKTIQTANQLLESRHLRTENLQDAQKTILKGIEEGEINGEIFTVASKIYFYLGDTEPDKTIKTAYFEQGIMYGKKAVAAAPKSDVAHFWYMGNTARTIQLRGILNALLAVKEIKKEIKLILDLNPKNVGAISALSSYYAEVPGILGGSIEKSEKLILQALEYQPKYTFLYIDTANVYIRLGKLMEAEKYLNTMLKIEEPVSKADFELLDKPNALKMLAEIKKLQSSPE
ncbi:MAG: hypothetical protein A2452_03945 [Candidatus Firestonebacteria bacterium RIFOXYC2_FULL_39_67]|nr:MAG: hypothetical protein A2536_08680 [Candidatus Firestonebacteria bacterium RIFOXYD2_FULL_39_29]OGF54715.1 MAG: hypothetical protein A2452_03945 [Candidatus Firestonebacteria bacterium RIFOXYC2_FULL_39_67]OGF57891.1 MAG: hypothetical protein A2497_04235 [Candidatus Firestonebacteria bacterium RifOxyC12_full_39_7]